MYSNCQVAGIVSVTMAASGNGRADLVPRAGSRRKFINWFRIGEDEIIYLRIRAAPPTRCPGHNNEIAALVRA